MEQYEYLNGPPSPRMVAELAMRHDALVKQLADAQATIAALQAQLESANKLIHKKNCDLGRAETIVNDLQSQLTQRTAELEAAKRLATNAQWQIDYVLAEAKKAFDLKGHYTPSDLVDCVLRPAASMLKERDELKAELERVRGLIAALPKVEGEIADETILDLWESDAITFDALRGLLQHRQGME